MSFGKLCSHGQNVKLPKRFLQFDIIAFQSWLHKWHTVFILLIISHLTTYYLFTLETSHFISFVKFHFCHQEMKKINQLLSCDTTCRLAVSIYGSSVLVIKLTWNFTGPSWPWSYGSWIYDYLCNQCLSSLMLWVWILIRVRCTTLY